MSLFLFSFSFCEFTPCFRLSRPSTFNQPPIFTFLTLMRAGDPPSFLHFSRRFYTDPCTWSRLPLHLSYTCVRNSRTFASYHIYQGRVWAEGSWTWQRWPVSGAEGGAAAEAAQAYTKHKRTHTSTSSMSTSHQKTTHPHYPRSIYPQSFHYHPFSYHVIMCSFFTPLPCAHAAPVL